MSNEPIGPEDVWDEFDHLVTKARTTLHLPGEDSTRENPEGRCHFADQATTMNAWDTDAIPVEPDQVCKYCLEDYNGTLSDLMAGSEDKGHQSRQRMGDLIEQMGGTRP